MLGVGMKLCCKLLFFLLCFVGVFVWVTRFGRDLSEVWSCAFNWWLTCVDLGCMLNVYVFHL